MTTTLNAAAYKFVELDQLGTRRRRLLEFCRERSLRGTILLAPEGINLFVAGTADSVRQLVEWLKADDAIGPLEVKESHSDYQPFTRMLVKVKQEIIAFGVEGIAPAGYTSRRVAPQQLKQWLDEGRPLALLDTRNDYEVQLGTFAGARHLDIGHFRDFPAAAATLPDELRQQPVVTFCTGGIRCEKAGPMLERLGFREVYQLDGGILNYFQQVGGEHYKGDCFVFDQRVAVDAALRETDAAQCYACQAILSADDQQSPYYVKGQSCPRCFRTSDEAMRDSIAKRQTVVRKLTDPLPGSTPYDQMLPLHVPGECEGLSLLEFLQRAVPSVPLEAWQAEVERDRILCGGRVVDQNRVVAAGEKYHHLLPNRVEPEVNVDIRILHEDADLVVVDKPAPLPMHVGGRFQKNTLSAILNLAYRPERLRHAHRLDANTSGVVVFARTRRVAQLLQPQFADGAVRKSYLARVQGHPAEDAFVSNIPIAREASPAGIRLPASDGAKAVTEFVVRERLAGGTTLLDVTPRTGRTNQIRAHLWSLGLPIVGDPAYLPGGDMAARQTLDVSDPPMCLHAWRLEFRHPGTRRQCSFEAPLPAWAAVEVAT